MSKLKEFKWVPIESLTDSMTKPRPERVTKHLPGQHNQKDHGRRGTGSPVPDVGSAHPERARIRKWDHNLASTLAVSLWGGNSSSGSFGSGSVDVKGQTDAGIKRIGELMREDPRWEEAEAQWNNLDSSAAFDEVYDLAQSLEVDFWGVANSVGYTWDDMGGSADPWELSEFFNNRVLAAGDSVPEGDLGYSIEELDGLTENVGTSMVKSEVNTYYSDAMSSTEWAVVGIDTDAKTATLERRHRSVGDDGLGPIESLGPLLGGEGPSFGPERIKVPANTVYQLNPDFEYMVIDRDDFISAGDQIDVLTDDWNDFESTYGTDPAMAVAYLDEGYLDIFTGGISENNDSVNVFSVNDSYDGSGVTVADGPDEIPTILRNLWANTAANEHRWALAMQMATRDEFGLNALPLEDVIGRSGNSIENATETYGAYDTGLRVYSRAVYTATQEYLNDLANEEGSIFAGDRALNDRTLPLMRGMGLTNAQYDEHYDGIAMGTRMLPGPYEPVSLTLNPMSSWTVAAGTARSFANKGNISTITRAYVPFEQIWGMSQLGNGSYREYEAIVLGGDDSLIGEIMMKKRNDY